jgi:hypothetical protein
MPRVVLLLLLISQSAGELKPPQFHINAPPEFASTQKRLESFDASLLADVVQLVGLRDPGPPISVELAADSSDWARSVAPWVAGLAIGETVVIFPSRSPSYPDSTLEDVLRHEVTHALIYRATSGQPVPRWFNEGLAMTAEREWKFSDQTRLYYQLVSGPRESSDALDRLFKSSQQDQTRAYLLSSALVRDLVAAHGDAAPGRILTKMREGASFEAAFLDVTSTTVADAERKFWDGQRVWTTWLPVLFSEEFLWTAVTLLAILAIYRRRRRNAEIEKRWEEEESE